MILYPKKYLENTTKITEQLLKENDIKGIILDVDNTLIYYNKTLLDGVEKWCENLKNKGIQFCIVSNNCKKENVKEIADRLGIKYISFAMKPMKRGLKKAQEIMKLDARDIAVVGDQIFTDVVGANRLGMFSILVKPLERKDIFITKIKRPFEEAVIKKYLKMEGAKGNVHK